MTSQPSEPPSHLSNADTRRLLLGAGRSLILAAVGVLVFLAVRTLDRMEGGQHEQSEKLTLVLQDLSAIKASNIARDANDARNERQLDAMQRVDSDHEHRISALEAHQGRSR